MPPQRVLVIDRDAARAAALAADLRAAGHAVALEPQGDAAAAALAGSPDPAAVDFDQVVIHLSLPGLDLPMLCAALSAGAAPPDALESAERRHIARVLEHTGGNRRRAAQLLGISRSTLLNKIRRYGIERVGHSDPD